MLSNKAQSRNHATGKAGFEIMAISPSLRHIHSSEFQDVYAPAEDTYLLIDALQCDIGLLRERRPGLVIEVGVGSGAVLSSLGMTLQDCHFVGVDLNPKAVSMAERTLIANGVKSYDVLQGKFLAGFRGADVVICNPPYVVTSDEEYREGQALGDITASWAGGANGRMFINAFLKDVGET
eukprot:CAMPEP_0204900898 /NCGR_PEP_ID=MMETSP1397-20131031/2752_1 /ASSEMBLY_ACC=CAM_ASM_000891 /TAXON_ID=49980 /ORGANISM="Climacostomum Climacostomum virens, Strain Stock W-24" /LENGTH=179 /DNA_ID=CAMNT_0052069135 /DNA_START=355 /DNA_END=890 /DNA_ORIENTATION=-